MPKVIKKKSAKAIKTEEEEVKNVLHHLKEFASEKQHIFVPLIIALIVMALAVIGFSLYRSSLSTKAVALEYDGYRLYHGLYQKQLSPREDRMTKALEYFKKSYDAKKTPSSLFYMASCYYELGRLDDALTALKELNERFPDDESFVPLSYYKMAMISLKKGEKDAALKLLDTIYNYKTGSFKDLALIESARILSALGRAEDSKKKYEELTKNFPQSPFIEEARTKLGEKKG